MFEGTITALITPFLENPKECPQIDYRTLGELIEWQIESGVNGIVACGTSGETATLDDQEIVDVVKFIIKQTNARVPVIVGSGTNSTKKTIAMTQQARELGADGVLVVSPYYNKPTQQGLFEHFQAVAAAANGLPVILYDIPGRTAVDISIETFKRLSSVKNIVGVKESPQNASKLIELAQAVGKKMMILAGDCALTYQALAVGGSGVISAAANVIPKEMVAITDYAKKGDMTAALNAQLAALEKINSLFMETNPGPVKAALKVLGRIPSETLRLPLVPVTEQTRAKIKALFSPQR